MIALTLQIQWGYDRAPMKPSRSRIYLLSALLASLILCAQAAYAARPCVAADAATDSSIAREDGYDCCDTSATVTRACLVKCTDGNKLSAHTEIPAAKARRGHALAVSFPRLVLPAARVWLAASGADPPKTIRFCTLLI